VGPTAIVVSIALLIACVCLGYLAFRRVRLMRGGGVDVCLRRRPVLLSKDKDVSAGWHFGVGRYRGNELAWYRLTSLRPGPTVVVNRSELEIVDRRPPEPGEAYAIPQATSVLVCRLAGHTLELAMAPGVLTGFLSWLESAPPGRTGFQRAG
jgi:hypothetical protein